MESSESYLEISSDIIKTYRNLNNNNTSDINLAFSTDSTGFMGRLEREIEIGENNENEVHKDELFSKSLKSHEEIEILRDSSSIKPNIYSYQKISKFPIKEIEYDSQPSATPLKLDLQFSKKVENLIIHDTIFRKFIIELERSLNQFIELKHPKLENRIFFEEDWEIPDYEKLILSLNFKGIPFKQEMLMWKMINTLVYERIKSMILYNSNEKGRRIKELKKNFFIKLEM